MRRFLTLACICAAAFAVAAHGQTSATGRSGSSQRISPGRISSASKSGKTVTPDPDILDGSKFDPEKRPLHGMLAEFEMGEKESTQENAKVGPQSGDPGSNGPPPPQGQKVGSSAGKIDQQPGASPQQIAQGPQAKPEGIAVQNLQVPEGAAGQQEDGQQPKPRDLQIGDATLQIQSTPNNPNVVGTQSSTAQQYEKKVPAGQQTNNRNRGVEKGKEMPQGL